MRFTPYSNHSIYIERERETKMRKKKKKRLSQEYFRLFLIKICSKAKSFLFTAFEIAFFFFLNCANRKKYAQVEWLMRRKKCHQHIHLCQHVCTSITNFAFSVIVGTKNPLQKALLPKSPEKKF